MKIKNNPIQVFQAIEYISLHLPQKIENNETFRKKLKDNILLQTQGDPVEIKESTDILTLMVVFNTVRTVCPEAVFKFTTGEMILLFNHQKKDVLRPNEIIEGFTDFDWKEVDKEKKVEEINLDLDLIWQETSGQGLLDRIKLSLKAINERLKNTGKIILTGSMQPLIFLFAQYKSYEFADEIYYQQSASSEPIRIN